MPLSETTLSQRLRNALAEELPAGVIFKHSDYATVGIPDFSVTAYGRTHWYEVKYVDQSEKFRQRGLQHDTCVRLAAQGMCLYVVFTDVKHYGKRTYIMHPAGFDPKDPSTHPWLTNIGDSRIGHDHADVARFIKNALRSSL